MLRLVVILGTMVEWLLEFAFVKFELKVVKFVLIFVEL